MDGDSGPFIPGDLRPDVGQASSTEAPTPGAGAEELRALASEGLSEPRRSQLGLAGSAADLDWGAAAVASPEVVAQELDGELLILDLASSEYYSLNDLGTVIWGLLGEGQSLEQVAAEICQRYDVDRERARADLGSLVSTLVEKGLINLRPGGSSPAPA